MANWTVSQGTTSATANVAIGSSNVVDLIISNLEGGSYLLSAANFQIGAATETETNKWVGGNVDSQVDYVKFIDNVDSDNNPLNTVTAQVYLKDYLSYAASTTLYIDIDEKSSNPPIQVDQRSVCFTSTWTFNYDGVGSAGTGSGVTGTGYTYTINDPEGPIAAGTLIDNGTTTTTPGSGIVKVKHQGTVNAGEQVCIADITFTRSGTNYFEGYGDLEGAIYTMFGNLNTIGTYSGSYVELITPTVGYIEGSSGPQAYTSFNYKMFYTPPSEADPVLEDDFCDLNHTADVKFTMSKPATVEGINVENQINTVAFESEIGMDGGTNEIVVSGSANTQYNLTVVGSGSKEDYGAESFYDFDMGQFTTSSKGGMDFTTNSSGKHIHYINFPAVTSDTRYDVILKARSTTTFTNTVPTTIGKAKITQYGTRNLQIDATRVNASKYGTLPASQVVATRPYRYSSSKYLRSKINTEYGTCQKALTAGTTLVLKRPNKNIKPGMIVTIPFQGNGVPHRTVVVRTSQNRVILSAASTIAANARVRFDLDGAHIVPFSFTIQNGGNTLSFGSTEITSSKDAISGQKSVVRQVADAGVSGSTTVNMETARLNGIEVGMVVSGSRVPTGAKVTAISRTGNSFTLDQVVTIPPVTDGVKQFLSFAPAAANDITLIHAMATISGTATVTGYLSVKYLAANTQLSLIIDNIVGTD